MILLFREIKKWYLRNFKVISHEEAISLGLTHYYNVYKNVLYSPKHRSIWQDEQRRFYKVKSLFITNNAELNYFISYEEPESFTFKNRTEMSNKT